VTIFVTYNEIYQTINQPIGEQTMIITDWIEDNGQFSRFGVENDANHNEDSIWFCNDCDRNEYEAAMDPHDNWCECQNDDDEF